MAKIIVERTVEAFSPRDWKLQVETTMKFKVETTIKVYSPEDWNFRVQTNEQKFNKNFFLIFLDFLIKRRLKMEERQKRVNVEKEGIEEGCDSEGRER